MHLDLPTLMVAGSFVSAVSGVFLIFAAMQTKDSEGMLWWASANLTLAAAIPLVATPNLSLPSILVAITLLNISPALVWASARACNGHRVDLGVVGAGAGVWLVAFTIPAVRDTRRRLRHPQPRHRRDLPVRRRLRVLARPQRPADRPRTADRPAGPARHLLRPAAPIAAALGALTPVGGTALLTWLGFVHFETLAFVVGTSIFTVAMAREKQELLHKINANTDSLTGLANRRAFYEDAATHPRHQPRDRHVGQRHPLRSRSLQGDQRHLRPRPRRRGAARLRPDLAQDAARQRPDRPHRRRGVRRHAARRRHGGRLSGRRAHARRLHLGLRRHRRFHRDAVRRRRPGGRRTRPSIRCSRPPTRRSTAPSPTAAIASRLPAASPRIETGQAARRRGFVEQQVA